MVYQFLSFFRKLKRTFCHWNDIDVKIIWAAKKAGDRWVGGWGYKGWVGCCTGARIPALCTALQLPQHRDIPPPHHTQTVHTILYLDRNLLIFLDTPTHSTPTPSHPLHPHPLSPTPPPLTHPTLSAQPSHTNLHTIDFTCFYSSLTLSI